MWVDDRHFDLDYHLRHTALPAPGSEEHLKRLIGLVLLQPLDRNRPLWEMWLVDGLERDRFAVLIEVELEVLGERREGAGAVGRLHGRL